MGVVRVRPDGMVIADLKDRPHVVGRGRADERGGPAVRNARRAKFGVSQCCLRRGASRGNVVQ